jgi:H+/Cl- antiporter ClcA
MIQRLEEVPFLDFVWGAASGVFCSALASFFVWITSFEEKANNKQHTICFDKYPFAFVPPGRR